MISIKLTAENDTAIATAPKASGKYGDLRDHQQVVRVPKPAERTGLHQGCVGQGQDPCRPILAQAGNYPEPAQLEQREQAEQRPDRRGRGGYKKGEAHEPAGMQQDEVRVAFRVRLDAAQSPQPDGIAVRPNELDNALQQDQTERPVEDGHRLSSTRNPAVKPGPSAFISARSQRSPVARASASMRSSTNITVVADMLP